jgi:hypothetical protein
MDVTFGSLSHLINPMNLFLSTGTHFARRVRIAG